MLREIAVGVSRHPVRSTLVFATFAIGFAAVLVTVSTIEGGRLGIRNDLYALGVDVIVALNPIRIGPLPAIGNTGAGTRIVDGEATVELEAELGDAVRSVVPIAMELVLIRDERMRVTTTLMATTPEFEGVLRAGLLAGRFLRADDRLGEGPEESTPVVLDEALGRDFSARPAELVGAELDLYREGRLLKARVVGIMKDPITLRKHLQAFDTQARARTIAARRLEFMNVYVPYEAGRDRISGVVVQLLAASDGERIGERMRAFFSARGMDPYFHVQKRWVDHVMGIVDRFRFLTHFFWALVLGVVLVLSGTIALLAVEERYREVAVRRAEGATVGQVVIPIVAEGVLLALAALAPGALLARAIQKLYIQPVLEWPPYYPPLAVWGTPALLLIVGALTNLLPARRIARLEPARVLGEQGE